MLHFTRQVLSLEFEDDEDLLLLDETVSQRYVLRVMCDVTCSFTLLILWGDLSRMNFYACACCRKGVLRLLYACALWLVDIMHVIFSTSQKWLQKLENLSLKNLENFLRAWFLA